MAALEAFSAAAWFVSACCAWTLSSLSQWVSSFSGGSRQSNGTYISPMHNGDGLHGHLRRCQPVGNCLTPHQRLGGVVFTPSAKVLQPLNTSYARLKQQYWLMHCASFCFDCFWSVQSDAWIEPVRLDLSPAPLSCCSGFTEQGERGGCFHGLRFLTTAVQWLGTLHPALRKMQCDFHVALRDMLLACWRGEEALLSRTSGTLLPEPATVCALTHTVSGAYQSACSPRCWWLSALQIYPLVFVFPSSFCT